MPLGDILKHLVAISEARWLSWIILGAIMGVSWRHLGATWGTLGLSLTILDASGGYLEASWGHLGGILGPGPREEAPRGPGEAAKHPRRGPKRLPSGRQEPQEGPEGPKKATKRDPDDVGNEYHEKLKNDDLLEENV